MSIAYNSLSTHKRLRFESVANNRLNVGKRRLWKSLKILIKFISCRRIPLKRRVNCKFTVYNSLGALPRGDTNTELVITVLQKAQYNKHGVLLPFIYVQDRR